jgi:hypothetical protein
MMSPLVERVLALPSVPYPERTKRLPDQPGLYFVIRGSELLYIGMSKKSIRRRWKTWHLAATYIEKRGLADDVRVAFIVYRDAGVLAADEKAVIREVRPEWNSAHVPGALERDQQRAAEECEWIDCDEHWHSRWPPKKPPTKVRPCLCAVHAHCAASGYADRRPPSRPR